MNLFGIRQQFDRKMRTYQEEDLEGYRDDWINDAWEQLAQTFIIPSLNRTLTFPSVSGQAVYPFPYDYNGTEISLKYGSRRLDPVPEEVLDLNYEYRSNDSYVQYYDWSDIVSSPLASVSDCVLVNESTTVLCPSAADSHVGEWIRFDPSNESGSFIDPGDYGYQIASASAGVSFTLAQAYRGPSCTTVGHVRPAETQSFIVYGIPDEIETFTLKYSAKPRRLYNPEDVPEWPDCGMAIALMAVSIGMDYLFQADAARMWWGRAMTRVRNLQMRRKSSQTRLVHDLTIGSVSGRRTGVRGVNPSPRRLRKR
jgi:hypothetical protein